MARITTIGGLTGVGTLGQTVTRPPGAPATSEAASADQPPLRSGYVRLAMIDAPFSTVDVQTTGEPTVPLADSGWDDVEIPTGVDIAVYRSAKGIHFDVPFTMDVLAQPGADVQNEWDALFELYRPTDGAKPPPLAVTGPVQSPVRNRWTLRSISLQDDLTKRRGGRLVRVTGTLTLWQAITPGSLETANPSSAKSKALQDRPQFAVAGTDGNTLKEIARKRLGNGRRYRDIQAMYANLDDQARPSWVRNPSETIPKGTQVRLPNG